MNGLNETNGREYSREYNREYNNEYNKDRDIYGYDRQKHFASKANDDEYILSEINRIKGEAIELRKLLEERDVKINHLENSLQTSNANTNAMLQKLSVTLNSLSDQLEESEVAITDAIERNQGNDTNKLKKVTESLSLVIEDLKKDMAKQSDKIDEAIVTVEDLEEKIEDKAEKKSVVAIHQRITTMFAVGVANLVGTIMTVSVLCYLILSLAR